MLKKIEFVKRLKTILIINNHQSTQLNSTQLNSNQIKSNQINLIVLFTF